MVLNIYLHNFFNRLSHNIVLHSPMDKESLQYSFILHQKYKYFQQLIKRQVFLMLFTNHSFFFFFFDKIGKTIYRNEKFLLYSGQFLSLVLGRTKIFSPSNSSFSTLQINATNIHVSTFLLSSAFALLSAVILVYHYHDRLFVLRGEGEVFLPNVCRESTLGARGCLTV